jgi:tRNA U34 5-methylaminomethyl-2-thiouridine-forming methyltransferase MnmC
MVTGDGSHSIYLPALDEHYHSRHGALNESLHVFIQMGLRAKALAQPNLRILEVGFGTGLNALLTAGAVLDLGVNVHYCSLEAYPLPMEEVLPLNYVQQIGSEWAASHWEKIHRAAWGVPTRIHPAFELHKVETLLENHALEAPVDLIYLDAFAPEKQPELWTEAIFQQLHDWLAPGGALVTYCAKGAVRRAMLAAGLRVERLQGPPGKREMLRAWRAHA